MKQKLFSQTIFIAKSLLWSLLLYVTTMMIIHWDDITRKNSDKPLVNYKQEEQAAPVKVTDEAASILMVKPVKAITKKVIRAIDILY